MDDEERLEGEEEMELDEASDGEDEDEETTGIPVSPANSDQLLGQTTPTTPGNITPEEVFHDPLRCQKFPLPGGKPLSIRRGPGRPRKERPLGITRGGVARRAFGRGGTRGKGLGYARGMPRRTKSKDDDTHSESPSPLRISGADDTAPDGSGESSGNMADRSMPAPEEPPYFAEQWPGKVCALCNLGERSQLGQGELLRLTCPPGFTPEKPSNRDETTDHLVDVAATGDKSPRAAGPGAAVTCRRQKSLAKCRNTSLTNFSEPVEELTIVGYSEEPEIGALFEPSTGHYYVHQSCIIWSNNSQDLVTESTCRAVLQASSRRCAFCSRYGAGISCKVQSCNRYFHFPCAAASSCFQDTKSLALFCSQHLGQVPLLLNGEVTCVQCYGMGDVSNLVMCSVCGQHYHGSCVGLALLPGVRAGWQCVSCRVCQVCRQPEDVSKVMLCEQCDKAYHPGCLRPIVTSIPKYGWKCKLCRVCTDCGSRTPGAGLSSRWHSHYTVCDSCYQQRNKGFSCPLCRKAYRAAAYREMVQCHACKKFVHGTCDPEADPLTYQQRKEAKPDYEYICLNCKSIAIVARRKDSIDEGELCLSASQESLDGESSELDYQGGSEEALYSVGLGKGKPFCATKIAKKRLGISGGIIGRPKGIGKLGYQKRQKMTEFGRKRGPKAKMRGIFGVPGVGLQRPMSDSQSKEDEPPGMENRLVLCSAKDKFVLTQDICVMCGAIGTDQEGCLIACAQCGQCYHPYCVNVKVTKVILQKGWRCLDCTVCEGCGERNDEARLILCDECDISYHIYCIDPPLDVVPQGTWKCKWCAQCQTCGSNDPGFNSCWQKSYTQCGPCASHTSCVICQEAYQEGDLIIQCVQCERWLHCTCDSIRSEAEAERCAEEGYVCLLCRPRDVPPAHLLSKPQTKFARSSPPPQNRSPEMFKQSSQQYLLDGVYLSEAGMNHIKSLMSEHQQTRKKRRKMLPIVADNNKEADIMATIESVVAGGSMDNSLEEHNKLELMDVKDEPETVLKEGMVWNQPPPEGFSICTSENGLPVLRRKRQRNLQKLGIGGFVVRLRGTRKDKEEEGGDTEKPGESSILGVGDEGKPRRKPQRRKPKTKLAECFPLYMQEAFFGKDLMDTTKEKDLESSSEEEEEHKVSETSNTIQLSQDELKAMEQVKAKQEKEDEKMVPEQIKREEIVEDDASDTEALGDILPISGDLLDNDLVNTIMNENDEDLAKASEALDELDDAPGGSKDELTDILSPHFTLESMVRDTGLPNMDSKDIEEIFKGVLTDESQESQESSVFSVQAQASHPSSSTTPLVSPSPHPGIPTAMPLARPQVPGALPSVGQSNLNSPMSFPPPSPYHSEYSNSPQFSPAFSEPPSPWVNPEDDGNTSAGNHSYNQSSSLQRANMRMEADETLGTGATMSSVLYANINHPEWKTEYPAWSDRCKQILKKWRTLTTLEKAPYLNQARENRSRSKKTQQEQDRLGSNRDRSSREAEQERAWKQLQALRQQQAQMQQQVIHEQRVHGTPAILTIARVHRQISEENAPQLSGETTPGLTTQLQVSTAQDTSQLTPLASPSPGSRNTFATPPLKAPRGLTPQSPHHQAMVRLPAQAPCRGVRPGFPQPPSPFSPQAPQSPHDFPQSPASSQTSQESHFQRFEGNVSTPASPYSSPQTPGTPRAPVFNPPRPPVYAPPPSPATSRTPDPYSQPPATPTPVPGPVAGYPLPRGSEGTRTPQEQEVTFGQQPEINRQLRDLLQRQQFTKKIEGVGANWTPDGQNNSESNQTQFEAGHVQLPQHSQIPSNTGEGTFRHPLPPGIVRPRMPIQPNVLIRNPIGINSRHPVAGNIQGSIDHRTRMLLQNRPQVAANISQQHFQGAQGLQTRMPAVRNTISEPYDILQQQQRFTDANQASSVNQRIPRPAQENLNQGIRMMGSANSGMVRPPIIPTTMSETTGVTTSEASEIPDNVTAELEKLEQEGAGPIVEVENVSAILGDLADDDDELLAEMGADFNILEYADPELDTIGEKTNILDLDLEQVEVDPKDEKQKKETKDEDQKPELTGSSSEITDSCSTSTSLTLTENSNVPTITPSQTTSQTMQAQVVQQQMHQHVQQAAAMGRPMLPGTRLMSQDGAIGVVTSTNTVTVSYPPTFPGHPQRISQAHLQVSQQQRLGMRVAGVPNVTGRVVAVNHVIGPRMPLAPPPPPPPPPYPGPPPPYPGPIQEQPLLLEDLLQQEKREQEQQQQQQQQQQQTESASGNLLSESEFERIKADVLGTTSPPQSMPVIRPSCAARPPSAPGTNWQQSNVAADGAAKLVAAQVGTRQPIATQTPPEPRVATFNIPLIPAPPTPPDNIVNEQDRQLHLQFEQWLKNQLQILIQQLNYYETEVQKLRKVRKSLNSKQRQLRKSGNELTETDVVELKRVTSEQSIIQKHLDSSRKQLRQHNATVQEYNSKQRQTQAQPNEPCSPLMSPSQHSPMHSPAALISQSPGPSMIQHSPATPIIQHSPGTPLLQHSPGNPQSTNPGTMSPHNVQQQSPRIGTPHSQGDESPFSPGPMPSPGLCNPNTTRITSPQHRAIISGRLTTSPGAFTPETRNQPQMMTDQGVRVHNLTQRFVRPPEGAQRRGGIVYSPQLGQQQLLTQQQHQQLLQRQQIIQQHENIVQDQGQSAIGRGTLQRQQILQQHEGVARQQILQQQNDISQDGKNVAQRNLQMVQQRQILQQQQQQQQPGDLISQDGQNVVAQRNLQMAQQRQQIIQQQQQQQQQLQSQQEGISQDGQNIVAQRPLQITQQRQQILQQQILQQQQQSENISQEGQNPINQRSLQMTQQQQRPILQQQQQNDIISQEGQNVTAQRNLQMVQQRQQILQQQQQILQQQHESVSQGISQEGQNSICQRTLQVVQPRQQQQQQDGISQDGNVAAQRNLQMAQRQQILQQQQHEGVSQVISQEGQNIVAQRTLQMAQQRQQILQQHQQQQQQQQQQHEGIPQDGQNVVAQRNLQMAQQRQALQQQQQILQQQQIQQQHEGVSQDGQSTVTQRSLPMTQRQQIFQQQHENISQNISQEGQNSISQRTLQLTQQRQQILHQQQQQQQHEAISQEGQTSNVQRSLQMVQQRQQIHQQQQQHEGVSQEGPNSINQRSLQMAHQRQHMLQQQQQQQQMQQRQQFLQMQQQQQQQQKPPSSPMVSQPASSPSPQLHQQLQQSYGQPPSSPMVQQATMGSPMLQQQLNPTSQPPSPMNRISPMLHGGHHHSSTTNQPPSSPMMPRSPMVAGSPMQMQRRQSTGNSPAMPDRPQSVENPGTPRTPHTPHSFVQQNANLATNDQQQISQQISQQVSQEQSLSENSARGGGNPNNPTNPVPFSNCGKPVYFKLGLRGGSPGIQQIAHEQVSSENSAKSEENSSKPTRPRRLPNFGRFGFFKLGLRGGSPMWSSKAENSKSGKGSETSQTKRDQSMEEKAMISASRKTTRIGSLVCADYNDFDDDSHTPPQASPTLEGKSNNQGSSLTSSVLDNGPLALESPGEKLEQLPDTTYFDDDKTIVNTEVTLSSTAQRDSDDITVIEQFGDSELVDVISGSLEGDMQEEYVLFEPEMVVNISADSNDLLCHALVNDTDQSHDLVQILEIENPESQSEEPILSDEDLVLSHSSNKKNLRLDIVRTLQPGKKLVAVTDTPESPDQDELRVDPSPGSYLDQSPDQDLMVSLVSESEVVIIDPTTKSPEDNLSKGSCDEETEKSDSNVQTDISKENTIGESLIDDQTKIAKQNKSPINFIFSDKTSYGKVAASTVHQAVSTTTKSISLASTVGTAIKVQTISSSSTPILASASSTSHLNQILIQSIAAETKPAGQFECKEGSFGNQKDITLPSMMASIVADAKIAAKLSQTALENISNPQQNKSDLKTISASEQPKVLSLGKISATSSGLLNTTESLNNPTKLILSVKPTSVTLSTPKMSIPDLSKKETLKSKEKQVERDDEIKRKEEEEIQYKIKNDSESSGDLSVTEEKKSDPLNTTDELESMLEAIHNPAENAEHKNDNSTTTLKRMSPVTDDLSLVNILENDTEPVENDKEQISSGFDVQKTANKSKEKDIEKANNDKSIISKEKNHQDELCAEVENTKPFLQRCLNEEKTLMEESSDDILDLLQNIISPKPEMTSSDELKSSLIYQMPTPLDTLPLNILQDSLDLEQENLENDQTISTTEVKSQPKSQNPEVKKSLPASTQTSTLVASTVAQLQKSTTTVPHLSPLSKPTELTSNVANVSHQLRTLLSSLQSNQTTVNQTGVTMASSMKSGSALSTSSALSNLNSSNNTQSGVLTLTRSDQGRPQLNLTSSVTKESDLNKKETLKEPSGIVTTISKVNPSDQVFRVTSSATALQSTSVCNLSSTSKTLITARTITTSISISSNVMLNAMLAGTTTLKPSIAGHGRSNTVPTQSATLLSSVLPSTSIQRSQSLQAILQVSAGCSTSARALVNTSSVVTSSMQCVRTIVPPLATSSGVSSTPSILQSTLSQASSHLLTPNQGQYKSPVLLPIDNKNNDLENQSITLKKESEEPKTQEKKETDSKNSSSSLRLEESQNVLLKQLLQNTACATTAGSLQGPTLPLVPSLEAQLDRPVLPTPPSLLPQLLNETPTPKPAINKQVLARETSFLSHSVTPLKVQSSPTKEETSKPPPLLPTSVAMTQRGQTESLKQQVIKSVPISSANSTVSSSASPQPVSTTITTKASPSVSTQQETSASPSKPVAVSSEGSQIQQRVAVSVSKVSLQSKPLMSSGVTAKSVQPPTTSIPSSVPGPQTSQIQQTPNQIQVAPKPIVTQQQVSSSSSTSSVPQQSVQQQVPHSHGTTAGPPQTVTGSAAPSGSNAVPLVEVKKEVGLEEVMSAASATPTTQLQTDTKDFITAKEELMDTAIDDKTDLKKLKRRQYQQKRKQSQGKDAVAAPQKKRSRKVSRLDEDYDTFVDNLMAQLRQLQPMAVLEPLLSRNFGVCPIFGCGDLVKIGSQKDYNARTGDLVGSYGLANLPGISDHYNTQPFGELDPLPPQQPPTTQRGFYDQEFPPLKLDDSDEKKENMATSRDVDSPDTIVSSSSPECVIPEFMHRYPGLRLIEEESDEESDWLKRVSPVIPLISPIPIRLKPAYAKDTAKQDKENLGMPKLGKSPPIPLRESGNVTVTLTLNSQAADDIMGVLKDLANILNIAPPAGYQIVERTTTPPSQKLGLYRTKGKDGKEGAPIDIQSILNGAAKFCRHCDVVILNSLIRKKVSDLPFLSKEEAEPGDELCFCSAACYVQFALMHGTPSTTQDKTATIVDHLCHKADAKLLEDDLKSLKKFPMKQPQQQVERIESMELDNESSTEKIKVKIEKPENAESAETENLRPKKHSIIDDIGEVTEPQPPAKIWKGSRYKIWSMGTIHPTTKFKKPTEKEIIEMLFRMGVTVVPAKAEDSRRCMFCQNQGDGTADGPARLLNFDVDKWVHLNCALWSEDVYEIMTGALMNLDSALQHSLVLNCIVCEKPGATVKCFKIRCTNVYHLGCAVKDGCVFYKNKSTFCSQHIQKNEKDNELTTLSVYRRVYVNRDENRQVAAVMHHSEHNHLLRVGSLIFLSVGQLLPHQLQNFHTAHYIYPVGYKIVRFYWSMRRPNKRCRYVCSIHDVSGRPEFRVLVQEPNQEDVELRDASPRAVWSRILEPLAELRKSTNSVQLFPRYVLGEDLFGLTEPAVVRVLESLPGIETLTDYRFKFGRNPLLELPLAINPTGSARTEARLRNQLPWKRPHTQRSGGWASRGGTAVPFALSTCGSSVTMGAGVSTLAAAAAAAGEAASCPYSKQFVHSKSSQYKKMKQEWRNNVYLARSKIQGLGLYAARDLEKHTMVIEYIGEIIRTELAEIREKQYEARNRGIYMFRLDEERVVDATLCGGLARYINHSCNPNCVAEIVEVERDLRIIIFAKRRIQRGEELAYDYKFDIEDDQHKIACACGAPNCRKWMN